MKRRTVFAAIFFVSIALDGSCALAPPPEVKAALAELAPVLGKGAPSALRRISEQSSGVTRKMRGSLTPETKQRLLAVRANITSWAMVVDGVAARSDCDPGGCDCCFFNGLLCSGGGAEFACEGVSRMQDKQGEIWRSPWQRDHDSGNSFSRDQGLAVLASLTHTRNVTLYSEWLSFIKRTGSMCGGGYPDCWLEFPFWCTMHHVSGYIGQPSPPRSLALPPLSPSICNHDDWIVALSAIVNENGTVSGDEGLAFGLRARSGFALARFEWVSGNRYDEECQESCVSLSRGLATMAAGNLGGTCGQIPFAGSFTCCGAVARALGRYIYWLRRTAGLGGCFCRVALQSLLWEGPCLPVQIVYRVAVNDDVSTSLTTGPWPGARLCKLSLVSRGSIVAKDSCRFVCLFVFGYHGGRGCFCIYEEWKYARSCVWDYINKNESR